MDNAVKTVYDPTLRAHVVTINPPYAKVQVTVHIDEFTDANDLNELFLYNFDVDSNCIEFAFGEKVEHVDEKRSVTYTTDPLRHVPPFRIQISHQLDTVDLEKFRFTVSYQLQF